MPVFSAGAIPPCFYTCYAMSVRLTPSSKRWSAPREWIKRHHLKTKYPIFVLFAGMGTVQKTPLRFLLVTIRT